MSTFKTILILGAVSIGSPMLLYMMLRPPSAPLVQMADPITVYTTVTNYVTRTNIIIETIIKEQEPEVPLEEAPMAIQWLSSPVTQSWRWDDSKQVWFPSPNLKDSYRPQPAVLMGLREDGVVVWRRAK